MTLSPTHYAAFDDAHDRPWRLIDSWITDYTLQGWSWIYVVDDAAFLQVSERLRSQLDESAGKILRASELGFHSTPFRPAHIATQLRSLVQHELGKGHAGVLLMVEMNWTVRTPAGAIYHREYEAALHELVTQLPLAAICLHPRQLMLGEQLLSGLKMHPQLIAPDGQIMANPHYVPPRLMVRQDERAQFQFWLESLNPAFGEAKQPEQPQTLSPQYNLELALPLLTVDNAGGKWKIRTFGPLRVYREDGTLLNWKVTGGATRKLKTLFIFLLFRAEAGASPEELIDVLWPELEDLEQGHNRLYQSVTSLRRVLTQPGGEGRQFLRQEAGRYLLTVPEHTWLDFPMFQELCFQGAALQGARDTAEAITAYQSAQRLYTGEFLADLSLDSTSSATLEWCHNRRYWFRDMYLKAMTNLARLYRLSGQLPEAQAACDLVLRTEPTYEAAQEEKLLAYAAAARPDAVRRQFGLFEQTLKRAGLGEPSESLRQLMQELLG